MIFAKSLCFAGLACTTLAYSMTDLQEVTQNPFRQASLVEGLNVGDIYPEVLRGNFYDEHSPFAVIFHYLNKKKGLFLGSQEVHFKDNSWQTTYTFLTNAISEDETPTFALEKGFSFEKDLGCLIFVLHEDRIVHKSSQTYVNKDLNVFTTGVPLNLHYLSANCADAPGQDTPLPNKWYWLMAKIEPLRDLDLLESDYKTYSSQIVIEEDVRVCRPGYREASTYTKLKELSLLS